VRKEFDGRDHFAGIVLIARLRGPVVAQGKTTACETDEK
jgi:hypothetical protein